jgi:hypothetical protein
MHNFYGINFEYQPPDADFDVFIGVSEYPQYLNEDYIEDELLSFRTDRYHIDESAWGLTDWCMNIIVTTNSSPEAVLPRFDINGVQSGLNLLNGEIIKSDMYLEFEKTGILKLTRNSGSNHLSLARLINLSLAVPCGPNFSTLLEQYSRISPEVNKLKKDCEFTAKTLALLYKGDYENSRIIRERQTRGPQAGRNYLHM